MSEILIEEISSKLEVIKTMALNENKKTVFCFASTKNENTPDGYLAALRVSDKAICLCLMIRSLHNIENLISAVDGQVDYVLYDVEAKFSALLELGPRLEKEIKLSKVFSFQGNKTTSNSVFNFTQHKLRQRNKVVSEQCVLLFGSGHLGVRIAQDFVDAGCSVYLTRRNLEECYRQAEAINVLKLPSSKGRATVVSSKEIEKMSFDVLLGCANRSSCIGIDVVKSASSECLFVDVGLGTFSDESLRWIFDKGEVVYVTNILRSFNEQLATLILSEQSLSEPDQKAFNGVMLYRSGIIAPKGSIVVDSVINPTIVYGVSSGNGLLLKGNDLGPYSEILNKVISLVAGKF